MEVGEGTYMKVKEDFAVEQFLSSPYDSANERLVISLNFT